MRTLLATVPNFAGRLLFFFSLSQFPRGSQFSRFSPNEWMSAELSERPEKCRRGGIFKQISDALRRRIHAFLTWSFKRKVCKKIKNKKNCHVDNSVNHEGHSTSIPTERLTNREEACRESLRGQKMSEKWQVVNLYAMEGDLLCVVFLKLKVKFN